MTDTTVTRTVHLQVFPLVVVVQSDSDVPAEWQDVVESPELMRYLSRARVVVGADRHGGQRKLLKDNIGIGSGMPVHVRDIIGLAEDVNER
jgi:hypothetical protein